MGTSTHPTIARRDSAGSAAATVGTSFLRANSANNGTIRGRCSPITARCNTKKADRQGGSSGRGRRGHRHGAGASDKPDDGHHKVDRMDVDRDDLEEDDASTATTLEEELAAIHQHDMVSTAPCQRADSNGSNTTAGSGGGRRSHLDHPFQVQLALSKAWCDRKMASCRRRAASALLPSSSKSSASSSSTAASSASSSSSQSQPSTATAKALRQSMHRILALNASAVRHHRDGAGGYSDDGYELDALHRAEWVRCHLVDELESIRRSRAGGLGVCKRSVLKQAGRSSSCKSGLSSSWTKGDSKKPASSSSSCPRRRSSFDDANSSGLRPSGEDVARTSYIYQRMDFDEGMHSFADLEAIDSSSFWLSSDSKDANMYELSPAVEATLVFNVGQVHRRSGDLDAASKCYDRALEVLREHREQYSDSSSDGGDLLPIHVHPVAVPILHNIGQLRYRRGDVRVATETYELALRVARVIYGERHPHVASALNCLGVLYYHDANASGSEAEGTGDEEGAAAAAAAQQREQNRSTRRAMELFEQALSIRIETLGSNHVDVATALNNIGRIHVQLDEFDKALGYYEDALRIRRDVLGPNSLDYAATAFNAGQSFHQKGELTRAAELYHEFLRVALMKFGHSHRDVAVVLSGIAQIHQEKREYDKALELYEASLCAGRAALGEDHSEIAMLLNRMGNFHFERERLEDALRCYRRGLKIERKVLPPDHPNIVVTLSNLGEIHRQRQEWDEAARMYSDCLDILRKKHDGADHIDVASTLSTIGLIHDQRGDTCLSLHYLQDALLMRRRLLGNDHIDVSATLVYIGTILYRKSVFSVAIELFSESLRIRQAALGKDHRDVAFVLYNIALVHQQRGCYEEAIEAYTESLRIEKLVLGETHRDVSMTLFKLGEVHRAAGNLDDALECFQSSLDIERSLSSPSPASAENAGGRSRQQQAGPDHAAMARALNEIGNIHLARGDVVPMMDALNEASRLYRAAGLSPNNVVVSGHLYALEFSCPEAAPAA